jgi:nitrite reductase (NADH) large subunit
VLCTVSSHDEVLVVIGRFMQYYREHARYLERTYDFVERLGIDGLKRILLDDSDGLCAALDAAVQAAVDAFVDPWQEGHAPVHPLQFHTHASRIAAEPIA